MASWSRITWSISISVFAFCSAVPTTTAGRATRRLLRRIRWATRWTSSHPWNQTTTPRPQKRDFKGNYSWVMSPRWYDKRTGDYLALDTGGGPIARFWATALAGIVDIGYVKATGHSVKIYLPKTATMPETEFEWKIPKWSNAIERDRARTYFQAYAAACALHFVEQAMRDLHRGQHPNVARIQGSGRSDRLRLP